MTDPCYTVISDLEMHASRLDKEAILEAQANFGNTELFEGLRMCYDPMVTFGVKKIPTFSGPDGQGLPWEAFKELARALAMRELTGHDARDAIELALSVSTERQWNGWYRRILIKDMRAGFSESTINKVAKTLKRPELSVPLFECMLAHDGANHEKKITGKKLLEPKLDGVRVITIVNAANNTATMYSRNGKVLENFGHITSAIEANIELFDRSVVLDGEMVSSSFQALMKQVHRKSDAQTEDARLMLFDVLPLSEFQAGESALGQRRRSNLLRSMKPVLDKVGSIDIIPQIEVDLGSYIGELQFKQYNKDAIEAGFEGILVKDPNAQYESKRSVAWLKIKPFLTVDLTIVDVEEGTGKNVGKLGALICEGTDQDKFIRVNVGSGLTDTQRNEIWNNKINVIGQIVEVKADTITQNQDAENTYSLRFPRFERFRGFIVGDKI
jgi:DNA ligase-1